MPGCKRKASMVVFWECFRPPPRIRVEKLVWQESPDGWKKPGEFAVFDCSVSKNCSKKSQNTNTNCEPKVVETEEVLFSHHLTTVA